MPKYRNYKNKLEMFLASRKGRRLLNVAYSWGAAVVILGALFKLTHLPFGNTMLFVGMITEFLVFFISGLEKPEEQYKWEQVYPELLSINPLDKTEMEQKRRYLAHKAEEARKRAEELGTYGDEQWYMQKGNTCNETALPPRPQQTQTTAGELEAILPKDDVDRLSESIRKLDAAIARLATLGEISASTLESCSALASQQSTLGEQTNEYSQRLATLNSTMAGLNELYQAQLNDITSQVTSIDEINTRLDQIRQAYHESMQDSRMFQRQNEEMVMKLRDLNMIYARLLDAMTLNIASQSSAPYGRHDYDNRTDYRTRQSGYNNDYHNDEKFSRS